MKIYIYFFFKVGTEKQTTKRSVGLLGVFILRVGRYEKIYIFSQGRLEKKNGRSGYWKHWYFFFLGLILLHFRYLIHCNGVGGVW